MGTNQAEKTVPDQDTGSGARCASYSQYGNLIAL